MITFGATFAKEFGLIFVLTSCRRLGNLTIINEYIPKHE